MTASLQALAAGGSGSLTLIPFITLADDPRIQTCIAMPSLSQLYTLQGMR